MSARLVLASASESRRRMLKAAGITFDVVAPKADEAALKQSLAAETPEKLATALAENKALSISRSQAGALVLGADQLLVCEGRIYAKARDREEARQILTELRGHKHELVTAAALAKGSSVIWRHVETASLWMRDFSDAFLDAYLAQEADAVLDLVGCYRIEGRGAQLFSRVEGDSLTIQGLPLFAVMGALRAQGAMTP